MVSRTIRWKYAFVRRLVRPHPDEHRFAQLLIHRDRAIPHFAHKAGLEPNSLGIIKWFCVDRALPGFQLFQYLHSLGHAARVEPRTALADIGQLAPLITSSLQRPERVLAVTLAA